MTLAELLMELHISTQAPVSVVAKQNKLSPSQLLCIFSIPFDGITQTELALKLSIDLSTISRNLDILINLNLVYKEASKHDKRSTVIFLSPKGKNVYENILSDLNNYYNNLNTILDYDHIQIFMECVAKINWFMLTNKINNNE